MSKVIRKATCGFKPSVTVDVELDKMSVGHGEGRFTRLKEEMN